MSEEEEKKPDPVSHNQLHEFHKDIVSDEYQVRTNATAFMKQQLMNTARAVIQSAEEKMEEREGKQVEQRDVQEAFDEALRPYILMDDFLTVMGEYEYELKQEASRTHVLDFDLDDD